MKTELFSKFMGNYIPYMRRRHLYHAQFINDDQVKLFDSHDPEDHDLYSIHHSWTKQLNDLQHMLVCVIKEKNNVYLIAEHLRRRSEKPATVCNRTSGVSI